MLVGSLCLTASNISVADDFDLFNVGLELDVTPVEIINHTVNISYTGNNFTFSFNLTDTNGSGINTVQLYYRYGWQINYTAVSLANTYGTYYNQTIIVSTNATNLTYYLQVYDNALNLNTTTNTTITVIDDDLPEFGTIQAVPFIATQGSIVNITAVVTDNIGVAAVLLHVITLGTTHAMTAGSGDIYYYATTYDLIGTYSYYITANDTNATANINTSVTNTFEIASTNISGYADFFRLYTPIDIYENSRGILLLKVTHQTTGAALSGQANNISCYIKYPNGTFFINGSHPFEDVPGIYLLNFTTNEIMGIYHCWALFNYSSRTYLDAGLFKVKWDVYQNVSRLYERIGGIIFLGHWERYNMTEQMAYHLGLHQIILHNISRTTQEQSFLDNLKDTAFSQAINILFWTIILCGIAVLSGVFATRRKKRKPLHPGELPATIAERITAFSGYDEGE